MLRRDIISRHWVPCPIEYGRSVLLSGSFEKQMNARSTWPHPACFFVCIASFDIGSQSGASISIQMSPQWGEDRTSDDVHRGPIHRGRNSEAFFDWMDTSRMHPTQEWRRPPLSLFPLGTIILWSMHLCTLHTLYICSIACILVHI